MSSHSLGAARERVALGVRSLSGCREGIFSRSMSVCILGAGGFDEFAESACAEFYAERMGRPSLAPGRYFRLFAAGVLRGTGLGAGHRLACSGLPERSSFPGLGLDRVVAGSFDDLSHSAPYRPEDSRPAVLVGSWPSGGLGSGVGEHGERGCDNSRGDRRAAEQRASRHRRGLRGVRAGPDGGFRRAHADKGECRPLRPQAEEEAVEKGVGEPARSGCGGHEDEGWPHAPCVQDGTGGGPGKAGPSWA